MLVELLWCSVYAVLLPIDVGLFWKLTADAQSVDTDMWVSLRACSERNDLVKIAKTSKDSKPVQNLDVSLFSKIFIG